MKWMRTNSNKQEKKMSKTSIMDGVKWIYGENLQREGKPMRVQVTIDRVESGAEFVDGNGRKTSGFAVWFQKTDKALGVTGTTVRRQLHMATGSEDYTTWRGKRITLYGVPSKKSATGWAVRVGPPEGNQPEPADTLAAEAARKEAAEVGK
jgi:hypothetical protein